MAQFKVDYATMVRTSIIIEADDFDEACDIVDELNESGLFFEDQLQPRLELHGISADETEVTDIRQVDVPRCTLDKHRLARYSTTAQRSKVLDMVVEAMADGNYDKVRGLLDLLERLDARGEARCLRGMLDGIDANR